MIIIIKQTEIYRLAKKEYYAGDTIGYYQTGNEFLHTENFILVDKKRRIRGVYNGTLPLEMERLIEDIGSLKKEDELKLQLFSYSNFHFLIFNFFIFHRFKNKSNF